jgi:serine/threonine-protein kinase
MTQTLGKYTLIEQLGSGAYAVVWRAEDARLGTVALKVLKPGWLEDEMARTRFEQEARFAFGLYHPHIAMVHDIGEADGRLYIAMRYVDGAPLDRLVKERGGLPWAEARAIVEQVASALDYAHGRGLVHRDVKPANIILSPSEGAVLTDFGLARAIDVAQSASLTGSTGQLGTPYYRAPELWLGERKAGAPTAATDVYSLACVLVELLTGQVLFAGDSVAEIITAHLTEAPPLPAAWPAGAPAGLDAALRRALAKKAGERTQSAGEFAAALAPHPLTPSPPSGEGGAPPLRFTERGMGGEVLQLAPGIALELVRIPAGEFLMGSADGDKMAHVDEKPQRRVYLAEYLIGRYPVTVGQFRAFVQAAGYETTADLKEIAGRPARSVSWHDARAFCEWATQVTGRAVRLPTEAEWEKAARGTDGRRYPWGDEAPDSKRCNFNEEVDDTTPVGRYSPAGDSPYGCADMAGNVWEWTSSRYELYPYAPEDGREEVDDESARVLRGGAFYNVDDVRCACRVYAIPNDRVGYYGFRVCAAPI